MGLAGNLLAGRYRLDEPIGAGGFSEVWRATDAVLARPVAVKLLHPSCAREPEVLARFRAEARNAAALWHVNIAHIYDYDEPTDGLQPYLVMELVDGFSLAGVLAGGPLSAAWTMDIVAQAAAGLQAAHAADLIHRDIKPGNLLLASSGTVKITDFGISHAIGSVPVNGHRSLDGHRGVPGAGAGRRNSGRARAQRLVPGQVPSGRPLLLISAALGARSAARPGVPRPGQRRCLPLSAGQNLCAVPSPPGLAHLLATRRR